MILVNEREVWTPEDRNNMALWCGLKLITGYQGDYWCEPKSPHEIVFHAVLDNPESDQSAALRLAHYVVNAGPYTKINMTLDHYRGFFCRTTAADESQLNDNAPVRRDVLASGSTLEAAICECLYWACAPDNVVKEMLERVVSQG